MSPEPSVPELIQALALATLLLERVTDMDDVVSDDFVVALRDTCGRLRAEMDRLAPVE